tara:strand:- start:1515 stop:2057 length:543 start_codon:yes stop_codon:yes gene_type:complete
VQFYTKTFNNVYILTPNMRECCIYCDAPLAKNRKRLKDQKYYCGKECRAKGQMNISFLGRKATPNDNKYRKKRRGTSNGMELSAVWDILRSLDEPKPAKWIIGTLHDEFGANGAWGRITTNGFRKKLNYFRKDCIQLEEGGYLNKYAAAKDIPFKDALSDKIKDFIEHEYLHNTSEHLKS